MRITHIPSGIVIAVQEERSQHRNKAKAMQILEAKLFHEQHMRDLTDRKQVRKEQVK